MKALFHQIELYLRKCFTIMYFLVVCEGQGGLEHTVQIMTKSPTFLFVHTGSAQLTLLHTIILDHNTRRPVLFDDQMSRASAVWIPATMTWFEVPKIYHMHSQCPSVSYCSFLCSTVPATSLVLLSSDMHVPNLACSQILEISPMDPVRSQVFAGKKKVCSFLCRK